MKQIAFYIGLTFLSISCRNNYYIPNTPNVVLPKDKGELELQVGLSEGFDIQASYTPLKNIGIMYNYNRYELDHSNNSSELGTLNELGLGVYGSSSNSLIRYSLFGGYGIHNYKGEYKLIGDFSDLQANKSFIQANIGLKGGHGELSLFYRISNLHYTNVNYHVDENVNQADRMYLDTLADKKNIGYITVGTQIGFGWEQFKFKLMGSIKGRTTAMPGISSDIVLYKIAILLSYNINTGGIFNKKGIRNKSDKTWTD